MAKLTYLANMGNKLNNTNTSQKSYWKIINKAPKIPPLFVNNLFILNCIEKGKPFTDFFSQQCKPVINDNYLTIEKIEQVTIENEDIISIIRKLNRSKANGSDGISGKCFF